MTLIGLNRPSRCNALNNDAIQNFNRALEQLEADDECRVGIVYGVGGNFCSGYDLNDVGALGEENSSNQLLRIRQSPCRKPLIAAIEGYAVGSGLELALLCDLRVAAESAKFGFLNRRFGVPLQNGGTVRLPQMIGVSRAMDLILTGRCIDASTAFQWGLVKLTVSIGAALGQAVSIATTLCQYSQHSLNTDRSSVYYAAFEAKSADDALRLEYENSKVAFEKEAPTGARKFVAGGIGRHGSFKVNKL